MKATGDVHRPRNIKDALPNGWVRVAARWLPPLVVISLILLWAKTVQTVYVNEGAFVWLGVDFRAYYTQALALFQGRPGEIYDLGLAAVNTRMFAVYSHVSWPMTPAPVPYPPVFVGLFSPFALLDPLVAFTLWSAVNLLAAVHIARRIADRHLGQWGRWAAALFLVSFPLGYAIFLGQPMAFLAVAATEFFLALEVDRDLNAGLWLGVLLIKPQYGLLIAPVLLWKGRWRAVAGVVVTGAVILLGSYATVGLPGLLAYPQSILDEQLVAGSTLISYPQDMTNWRMAFFVAGRTGAPWLSDRLQFGLTMVVSGITAALVFVAWRGPWLARDRDFPARMTLLWLGTVLANYHSHAYGPVLAALPAAVLLFQRERPVPLKVAIVVAALLPTALMLVLRSWFLPLYAAQIALVFGIVAWECGQVRVTLTSMASWRLPGHALPWFAQEALRSDGKHLSGRA
jgi:hypothetical protein